MSVQGVESGLSDRFTRIFEEHSDKLVSDGQKNPQNSYQGHFSRSREEIVKAIEGLENTALILGAGPANDVPLGDLAERFKHIVLVDIDLRHTETAVSKLPPKLRQKCTRETADLTGFFSEFGQEAEKIAQEGLPYDEFVSKILDLPPQLKRAKFDYQQLQPSFVCSSLVSTQLTMNVIYFLEKLSKEFYNQSFIVPPARAEEFVSWLVQFQINHIDELHRMVAPDGKVYFADHISTQIRSLDNTEIQNNEVLGAKKVWNHVIKLFTPVNEKKWIWTQPYITSSSQESSTQVKTFIDFQITALTLTPKKM